MGVAAQIKTSLVIAYNDTAPVGTVSQSISEAITQQITSGTGDGKADMLYTRAINIAASGNVDIDLSGTTKDAFGENVVMDNIKAIYVFADDTNTNDIIVGGAGTGAVVSMFGSDTDYLAVKPGGLLLLTSGAVGYDVVATTADLLRLSNSSSGSGVTGKLIIVGASA